MKTTLKPGRNLAAREQSVISQAFAREPFLLEREIKLKISKSTPRGRTYRIGRITKTASKKLDGLGLKSYKTAKGNKRYIVGAKFHRASARGQAPAIRTGGLINATRTQFFSLLRARVINSKKYGVILDSETGLNRPFFAVAVRAFKPGFLLRMKRAFGEI